MHQRQTFLATIGHDLLATRTLAMISILALLTITRGSLYGPAFHQRSQYRSTGELSGFVEKSRHLWGTIAMLSVDQFLRLMCVPAVVFAFLVASQISAAVSPSPAMAMARE
jgi:hypothetical protein